jgi:hypothetical protein
MWGGWPNTPDAIPALAEALDEVLDRDELAGLVCDASELAGRLALPVAVRVLAASVAAAAESALASGLAAWERCAGVLEAGQAARESMKASETWQQQ